MSNSGHSVFVSSAPVRTANASRLSVSILLTLAAGMAIVWAYALVVGDERATSTFAYGTISCAALAASTRILFHGRFAGMDRGGLLLILLFYALAPAVAAIPILDLKGVDSFSAAYFEMASALTTTGATIFWNVDLVPDSVILWRSILAGFGGLVCLVSALAILAPLSIGGFEVDHMIDRRAQTMNYEFLCASEGARVMDLEARIFWALKIVAIPYLILIGLCTFALAANGVTIFEAICLALGSLSTTGFAPHSDGVAGYHSLLVEVVLVTAMIPAAIGISAHVGSIRNGVRSYLRDSELRYMAIIVTVVVLLLFFRHWIGAIETQSTDEIRAALAALWGTFFMAVSFATTTGFESAAWEGATEWSGLKTPGVALVGLAIVGGGAASTAGGVKLVRAALLAKHSMGELRRLARPSSVQPIFSGGRSVTFDALRIVWVFVMLYAITLAVCALGLTATGFKFVDAFAGSIAAISNTGPLLPLISGEQGAYTSLDPIARFLLCGAMIVGRMETLAVVALFSVSAWRR